MPELTGAAGGDLSGLSAPCLQCGMVNQANPMKCLEAPPAPAPAAPAEPGGLCSHTWCP